MKPQPLSRGKGIAACVFGVPGAGKTRLLGTGGEGTLIVRPPSDHTDSIPSDSGVQEIVVTDWNDMNEVQNAALHGEYDEFDYFCLDSISLFQDHGIDDLFQQAVDRKPERADYGPDKGEYGINMGRLQRWTRDLVACAKGGHFNFIVTAHPFEWWDPIKEEDVWAPYIQGKNMSPKICGYMNIVAYLQKVERDGEDPQEILLTESDGFYGKDQFQCFPELKSGRRGIIEPTLPKLMAAVDKARGSRKAKTKRTGRKRPARRK